MMKKLRYVYRCKDNKDTEELNSDPKKYIGLFLQSRGRSGCPWYNSLSTLTRGVTNIKNYYSSIKYRYWNSGMAPGELTDGLRPVESTAKSCPAIQHILDTSIMVMCPVDVHISINKDGDFLWNAASTSLLNITSHPKRQYESDVDNVFRDCVNLKFELPLLLNSNYDTYMFLQPQYHWRAPYNVLNGTVSRAETLCQQLNVNTFWHINPNKQMDYFIPAGTPLAYIWFNNKHKLEYDCSLQQRDFLLKFAGARKFFFKDAQRK